MKRKLTAWLSCLALAVTMLPCTVFAADGDVIEISTAEELAKIGNDEDYPLSGNYILANDITLTEVTDKTADNYSNWTPIGTYTGNDSTSYPFTGTFNGAGHSIEGLYISSSTDRVGNYGLFAAINGGIVRDLKIDGTVLATGSRSQGIGIITGFIYGDGIITNCYVTGSVSGTSYVGGIAGYNAKNASKIINSSFIGNVTVHATGLNPSQCYGGGIISSVADNFNIINCYSSTNMTVAEDVTYAGSVLSGISLSKNGIYIAYGDTSKSGFNFIYPNEPTNATNLITNKDDNARTTIEMQSDTFVSKLNNNVEEWNNNSAIPNAVKGTLSEWVTRENDYPIQSIFVKSEEPAPATPAPQTVTGKLFNEKDGGNAAIAYEAAVSVAQGTTLQMGNFQWSVGEKNIKLSTDNTTSNHITEITGGDVTFGLVLTDVPSNIETVPDATLSYVE